MNSDFAAIVIKMIFAILSVTITYFVIPFLTELTEQYRDTKIEKFIRDSVIAAEQVIKGDKKGAEKKAKVLTAVTAWLSEHHIDISNDELDDMIESMVYTMNHPEVFAK